MNNNHRIPKGEETYRKLINHPTTEQENTNYETNKRYRKIKH